MNDPGMEGTSKACRSIYKEFRNDFDHKDLNCLEINTTKRL